MKQKNQSWAIVTSKFNDYAESGSRTVQQFKTVYDMTKRQTKKNLSNEKVNLLFVTNLMYVNNYNDQCFVIGNNVQNNETNNTRRTICNCGPSSIALFRTCKFFLK